MLTRKCDICGSEMRVTSPRYTVTFDSWLYKETKDICVTCFERIKSEIKQADTPQEDCDRCIWSVCNYNKVDWDADTPQTDAEITELAKEIVQKMIDDAVIAEDAYPDLRQRMHEAVERLDEYYSSEDERSE